MKKFKNIIATTFLMALLSLTVACSEGGETTNADATESPVEVLQEDAVKDIEVTPVVDDKVEAIQYSDDMIEALGYVSINIDSIISVVNMVEDNPELSGAPELILKLDDIVVALEDNRNQIKELSPPTDFKYSYDMVLTGVQEYINGVASYRDGVINRDTTLTDKGYEHFNNAEVIMAESINHMPK